MAIFIPISIRSKCCPDTWFKVDDVTIGGLSKNHGRCRDECQVALFRVTDFIGSDGDTCQVQWCDTFWISCKAWSTWKRSKPEITAPDKYLKDQDNTSDLKLPLRFSNSNATFVIEITFDEDGHQDMADDDGEVISGYQSETNLFWHLGLSTERTFI